MKKLLLLMALTLLTVPGYGWERESFYSDKICAENFKGSPTTLSSGVKPDCETEFAVVEFDWAKRPKMYECIGQALTYAFETGKTPVCALMAKTYDEEVFAESLRELFKFSGVKLRLFRLSQQ